MRFSMSVRTVPFFSVPAMTASKETSRSSWFTALPAPAARHGARGFVHQVCKVRADRAGRRPGRCGRRSTSSASLMFFVCTRQQSGDRPARFGRVHDDPPVKPPWRAAAPCPESPGGWCAARITTPLHESKPSISAEQLVQGLFPLVVAAQTWLSLALADGVDLVDEDDGGGNCLAACWNRSLHTACADAHEHLHKVRAGDRRRTGHAAPRPRPP